jgi:hypothetical protein
MAHKNRNPNSQSNPPQSLNPQEVTLDHLLDLGQPDDPDLKAIHAVQKEVSELNLGRETRREKDHLADLQKIVILADRFQRLLVDKRHEKYKDMMEQWHAEKSRERRSSSKSAQAGTSQAKEARGNGFELTHTVRDKIDGKGKGHARVGHELAGKREKKRSSSIPGPGLSLYQTRIGQSKLEPMGTNDAIRAGLWFRQD